MPKSWSLFYFSLPLSVNCQSIFSTLFLLYFESNCIYFSSWYRCCCLYMFSWWPMVEASSNLMSSLWWTCRPFYLARGFKLHEFIWVFFLFLSSSLSSINFWGWDHSKGLTNTILSLWKPRICSSLHGSIIRDLELRLWGYKKRNFQSNLLIDRTSRWYTPLFSERGCEDLSTEVFLQISQILSDP
jgi:hypothetical protein